MTEKKCNTCFHLRKEKSVISAGDRIYGLRSGGNVSAIDCKKGQEITPEIWSNGCEEYFQNFRTRLTGLIKLDLRD